MNKLTTGLLAGGVVGALSVSYVMMDKRSRNRAVRDSKRLMKKSKDMFKDISDML